MTTTLSSSQSKKRKHRSTEEHSNVSPGEPQKETEKRNESFVQLGAAPRGTQANDKAGRTPKEHSAKSQKTKSARAKGKSRASNSSGEFRVINASLVLSIPPVFASDLRAGVEEMLDSMVMRYIPTLQGVLLAHSNLQFLHQTAAIRGDCPFAVCNVCFDATVWSPCVSMKLVGKINLCSPDHISLLVHRIFNVSIPRHHIPQDQWIFEYGPAENDPEFGEGRGWDAEGKSNGEIDEEGDVEMKGASGDEGQSPGEAREPESSGRWVHHLTGGKIGDSDGYLEFTVIGLTVANEMLSLQGSIQPDPFCPEHVLHASSQHAGSRASTPPSPGAKSPRRPNTSSHQHQNVDDGQDEEEGEETDGFAHLTKLTDEATQKARREKEEAERLERKAKKRKRRAERAGGDGDGDGSKGKKAKREKSHGKKEEVPSG
ncbi:hypothetical protein PAXRUDRAFT_827293 [Paxillus rubicundulus Ve08.2h10]|uniref:RPA43 OB domain-containing protein n=1 Tax=Paxillus rubicundulus Ve08.2h10 TaxID=930991 RepID=A0A0D0DQY9_9AGAM|nr:hypothetical protein PAXRUDRAFT_827293 [Paxillus rubicundulus Ve08.2h10]